MSIETATAIWLWAGAYAGVGAVVALATAVFGAARMDHAAAGAGVGFRVLIVPGVILLWPIVLGRLASFRRINAPVSGGPANDAGDAR